MRPVLTADRMAALEAAVIASGTDAGTLMERAGAAVAEATAALGNGRTGRRFVVVCGRGGNGGDGAVAARRLHDDGARVDVFATGDATHPAARAARESLRRAGVDVADWDADAFGRAAARADAVVDAVLGIGARGPLREPEASAIAGMEACPAPVLAVDVPSGLEADRASIPGTSVTADATVTFGALKPCLVLDPARRRAGAIVVADPFRVPPPVSDLAVPTADDVADVIPSRAPDAHKRSVGVVGVIAGSAAMPGAAVLVAAAAMRTGAGLVRVAASPSALAAVAAHVPEVVGCLLDGVGSAPEGFLGDLDALVIGPGIGADPGLHAMVRSLVASAPVPVVLDADGLHAFDGHPEGLASRRADLVLTPHAGEYAALMGRAVDDDRVAAARELARATGAVALLKGPATVVAWAGGTTVNPTGGPRLATAGSGDVLAGIIGALLARGATAPQAAWAAAYLHGRAADLGDVGTPTAGDLVDRLPIVLAELP